MLRDAAHRMEYVGARIMLGLLRAIPFRIATASTGIVSDAVFVIAARRRRIAIDNILCSGVASTRPQARSLARAAFRHFSTLLVETLHPKSLTPEELGDPEKMEWDVHPDSRALLDDPDANFILAAGHLGNWEIGAQALALRKPVIAVTRNLGNPYLDRYLRSLNPRQLIREIPKYSNQPFRMLDMVKSGEALALMIDQNSIQQLVWVDFFGRPAATYTAVALLPLILNCPICFGSCIRIAERRYRGTLSEPLPVQRTGDRKADVLRLLQELNKRLETAIRQCPEQYMWAHRRWRKPRP